MRELSEVSAGGGVERSSPPTAPSGASSSGRRSPASAPRRVTVLDQEFHESGKLVRERRWRPTERGAELVSERRWYLNGQPKTRSDYSVADGRTLRRETGFHDNGRKSFEGAGRAPAGGGRGELATGTQQSFDAEGRLRGERIYDERGRIKRERELDERGNVVRDDEVFEDGSRKAVGR